MTDDVVGCVLLFALIVLFAGDPDLMDAIIKWMEVVK